MKKEKYEDTNLDKYYKQVLICEKCSQKYGHNSPSPKSTLCPFCERDQSKGQLRGRKKKVEEDEEFEMRF